MKSVTYFILMALCLTSCDYILKDRESKVQEVKPDEKVILGNDKDKHGCVTSAGYHWSAVKNECIRVFEEGYRLNPVTEPENEGNLQSAFIIFDENGDRAELYLPENTNSLVLKRETKEGPFVNKHWTLHPENGYTLKKDGIPVYIAAKIEEDRVTGDYNQQS